MADPLARVAAAHLFRVRAHQRPVDPLGCPKTPPIPGPGVPLKPPPAGTRAAAARARTTARPPRSDAPNPRSSSAPESISSPPGGRSAPPRREVALRLRRPHHSLEPFELRRQHPLAEAREPVVAAPLGVVASRRPVGALL